MTTEIKPPRPFDVAPRLRRMRDLIVDNVHISIYEDDVAIFVHWIEEGQHAVHFTCDKQGCNYKGTAKLSTSDVAYAATGGTYLTCPKCDGELEVRIPENSHELTQQVLEVVKS